MAVFHLRAVRAVEPCRYLDCGDIYNGFARVKYKDCILLQRVLFSNGNLQCSSRIHSEDLVHPSPWNTPDLAFHTGLYKTGVLTLSGGFFFLLLGKAGLTHNLLEYLQNHGGYDLVPRACPLLLFESRLAEIGHGRSSREWSFP